MISRSYKLLPSAVVFLFLIRLSAQTTEFPRHVAEHRMALTISNGRLSGPGAAWLRDEAKRAQFVFIGAEHGISEVTLFAGALWHDLASLGYRHVALEIGPWVAAKLDRYARHGDLSALEEYRAAAIPQLPGVSEEEIAFAKLVGQVAKSRTALIWGLDQEQRAVPMLKHLEKLAPNEKAQVLVRAALAKAESQEKSGAYTMSGLGGEIEAIRQAFRAAPGTESAQILDAMESNNRLYEGQRNPLTRYRSNLEREEMMKKLFLRDYRNAQKAGEAKPRVMVLFGAWHGLRGLTPVNVSSLGNFLAEFGLAGGSGMLNVVITCGQGGKMSGVGDERGKVVPCDVSQLPWMKPLTDAATWDWTLFDLRALRPMLRGSSEISAEWKQWISGYDALVIVKGTTPLRFGASPKE